MNEKTGQFWLDSVINFANPTIFGANFQPHETVVLEKRNAFDELLRLVESLWRHRNIKKVSA